MFDDPIVDEVRKIRERLTEKHGYDVKALFDILRQRERLFNEKIVSREPAAFPCRTTTASNASLLSDGR